MFFSSQQLTRVGDLDMFPKDNKHHANERMHTHPYKKKNKTGQIECQNNATILICLFLLYDERYTSTFLPLWRRALRRVIWESLATVSWNPANETCGTVVTWWVVPWLSHSNVRWLLTPPAVMLIIPFHFSKPSSRKASQDCPGRARRALQGWKEDWRAV